MNIPAVSDFGADPYLISSNSAFFFFFGFLVCRVNFLLTGEHDATV